MSEIKITSTAELKKWVKDRINFLRGLGFISTAGLEKSKALVLELNFVLEKINELETFSQKPIERAKQTLDFLTWLKREVEAEYPNAIYLTESLDGMILDLQALTALKDDKKILGDDKSG